MKSAVEANNVMQLCRGQDQNNALLVLPASHLNTAATQRHHETHRGYDHDILTYRDDHSSTMFRTKVHLLISPTQKSWLGVKFIIGKQI